MGASTLGNPLCNLNSNSHKNFCFRAVSVQGVMVKVGRDRRGTKFQQQWIDGGDFPWLKPVRDFIYHAFCTFCSSKFLKNSGKSFEL